MTLYEPQPYDDPPLPTHIARWGEGHGWQLIPAVPSFTPHPEAVLRTPAEWRAYYAARDTEKAA